MMKSLLTICFISIFLSGFAQSETHDFITYDTLVNLGGLQWNIRISRPRNLFVAGNADTISRPCIFMMPGQGEQGNNNASNLIAWGPHANYNPVTGGTGWDGGFTLGNGKHYPMLITISFINNVTPYPSWLYQITDSLIHWFHPRAKSLLYTGLSQGAFTWGGMIEYEATLGDQAGMKIMTALMPFEGTPTPPSQEIPARPMPCSTAWCDTSYYITWLNVYHGRYFYFEGSGSDNSRDGWHYAAAMNHVVPGSAYFSYENVGGGAHCCWDTMYSLHQTNWSCVTPLGPFNAPSQAGTNQMGNYRVGQSTLQWLYTQGDTTLLGGGASPPTVNGGTNQTIHVPVTSVTLSGSATAINPATSITSYSWSQVSGPNTGTFSSTTVTSPTFSNLILGTYVLKLTATDNNGNIGTGFVDITLAPHVPIMYHWNTSTANLVFSKSTYPLFYTGDTIYVGGYLGGGGYPSIQIDTLGIMNMPGYGYIKFTDSAKIKIDTGSITLANSLDTSNFVYVIGMNMSFNVNPTWTTYQTHGHSHFITFDSCIFRNSSGFFLTAPGSSTVANFSNTANDTVNCFYHWEFKRCKWDTVGSTTFGGIQCLIIGAMLPNQMWVRLRIDSNVFNYLPNPTTGGGAVNLQNCFMCEVDHNTFSNLGVVPTPGSHAAVVGVRQSLVYFHDNTFGDANWGNAIRSIGMGTVPVLAPLFATWDPHYDGVGRVYGNTDKRTRKYPFFETQRDDPDSAIAGLSYYKGRRSPHFTNNTGYRLAMGIVNEYYNPSMIDGLSITGFLDTIECHNTVLCGPTDTLATLCTAQGCNRLITYSGSAPLYDTSGNSFFQTMVYATSGFADSILFRPLTSGPLYHAGVPSPAYRTLDLAGTAVPSIAPSIGSMEPGGTSAPTVSAGANQRIGSTATLITGSCTANGGAFMVSATWSILSIPPGAPAPAQTSGGTANVPTLMLSNLVPGTYTMQLLGTDSNGNSSSSTMAVTVVPNRVGLHVRVLFK